MTPFAWASENPEPLDLSTLIQNKLTDEPQELPSGEQIERILSLLKDACTESGTTPYFMFSPKRAHEYVRMAGQAYQRYLRAKRARQRTRRKHRAGVRRRARGLA